MAKETVKAVRNAELSAAQIEKDAALRREQILNEAQQKAKSIVTSMVKECQTKADRHLYEATAEGEKMITASKQKAETEILVLKDLVKNKEQEAITLVLSNII